MDKVYGQLSGCLIPEIFYLISEIVGKFGTTHVTVRRNLSIRPSYGARGKERKRRCDKGEGEEVKEATSSPGKREDPGDEVVKEVDSFGYKLHEVFTIRPDLPP